LRGKKILGLFWQCFDDTSSIGVLMETFSGCVDFYEDRNITAQAFVRYLKETTARAGRP